MFGCPVQLTRGANTDIVNIMHKTPTSATDAAQDTYDLQEVFAGGRAAKAILHQRPVMRACAMPYHMRAFAAVHAAR